jgi:hypothetical protein
VRPLARLTEWVRGRAGHPAQVYMERVRSGPNDYLFALCFFLFCFLFKFPNSNCVLKLKFEPNAQLKYPALVQEYIFIYLLISYLTECAYNA